MAKPRNNIYTQPDPPMCLAGNEQTMIETLNALNDARLMLRQWGQDWPLPNCEVRKPIEVTYDEGIELLNARIWALETKCRELGIHGPAPKADPGDQRRIVDAK